MSQDELDQMLVEMSLSSIDDHTSSMAESINDVVRALEEQNEHLQTIAERLQKLVDIAEVLQGIDLRLSDIEWNLD